MFSSNYTELLSCISIEDYISYSLADNLSRETIPFAFDTQVHCYLTREDYLRASCPFLKTNSRKRKRAVFEYIDFEVRQR